MQLSSQTFPRGNRQGEILGPMCHDYQQAEVQRCLKDFRILFALGVLWALVSFYFNKKVHFLQFLLNKKDKTPEKLNLELNLNMLTPTSSTRSNILGILN